MNDLIAALSLIESKLDPDSYSYKYPIQCEHDDMYICVDVDLFTDEEIAKLDKWGFCREDGYDGFVSHRFGSC